MRIFLVGLAVCLCLVVSITAFADSGVSLVGPETVYPRAAFELNLLINRADVYKISFEVEWDSPRLQFHGLSPEDNSGWIYEADGQRHILIRQKDDAAPEALCILLRLQTTQSGEQTYFTLKNVVLWTPDGTVEIGDLQWRATIGKVNSDDNFLSDLSLADGLLSPEFSPYQQTYTATVPSYIAQAQITAIANNPDAVVQIVSPELAYGMTTEVTVTVTAEDGSIRVYTIAVTREDDPNRTPSGNCNLQLLEVTEYKLSPRFSPDNTEYVLWLPYETDRVDVTAIPEDIRTTVSIVGNLDLKPGQDNPIYIICTAEDGTQKTYTVIAKRAEPYAPQTAETAATVPAGDGAVYTAPENIPTWVYIVVAVAAVTGCAAVGILITDRKK